MGAISARPPTRWVLVALTALVMTAFAGNSVLNRLAVADGAIGAVPFAVVRLWSGAAVLMLLAGARGGLGRPRGARLWLGAPSLLAYAAGFSLAYRTIDAATGALILFGGVQVVMLSGALALREPVAPARWVGIGVAMAGLALLLGPGAGRPLPMPAALMTLAALGWGVYSLAGRGSADPLGETAANFAVAAPLALPLLLVEAGPWSGSGVILAALSGAVTSGLGYALWYAVLPRLTASAAALAQLSVPLIALAGGALLLSEWPEARFVPAAALILGGIALGLAVPGGRRRPAGRSG